MDLLALYQPRANAPLDDLAKLMGFPGKLRMDGSAVWKGYCEGRIGEIRDYCETDVVNTYLVFLRFQLMRGLRPGHYDAEVAFVRESLGRLGRTHWQRFLGAWPEGGLPQIILKAVDSFQGSSIMRASWARSSAG